MATAADKLIRESPVHILYLSQKEGENPVVIKRFHSSFPADDLIAQLKNEFVVTQQINIPGLRKPVAFRDKDGNYYLELEYIEGKNLTELKDYFKSDTGLCLDALIQLCDTLGNIHGMKWVHGSIAPTNILFNTGTNKTTLIDGSLMSRNMLRVNNRLSTEKLAGLLPYFSPEQTGRTNRALDNRSDLYSLGIVIYELITGKRPFAQTDTLELMYAHLATMPVPPINVNPGIPESLSAIIMKLLAKNAEDRYQSAFGLKYDLEKVRETINNPAADFIPGENDFSGQLLIPQKLYGREEVINSLTEKLRETHQGAHHATFITGRSGTGKSAVVLEVLKPITEKRGIFLSGKFDQFVGNIPYSAWIEIFEDFVNQILTSSESEIRSWRDLLVSSLGNTIGVLADLIPNLRHVIPDLPQIEEVGVLETQNRLSDLLNQFFKTITDEGHPVTVFIDDLQWADNASLNLLKTLILDDECRYLFIIGAYRSESVEKDHPLQLKLNEIEKAGKTFDELHLDNLSSDHVSQLLADTFNTPIEEISELSEIVYNKTKGNPFFTVQFLHAIYEEDLIRFNWDKSKTQKKPEWEFDLEAIHSKLVSNNLVELLVNKILELPETTVRLLKTAACIGNSFRLNELSFIENYNADDLAVQLEPALDEGFIFYKNINQIHRVREGMDVEYKFSHDRIQHAFYSLIPEEVQQKTHYEIGKIMLGSLSGQEVEKQIFQLVFHLNFGAKTLTDSAAKRRLAELNLMAAHEAKKIIAYDSAYLYAKTSSDLMGEEIWKQDFDFALRIGHEMNDCTFLTQSAEEAERYFDYLMNHMPDNQHRAELYLLKIEKYTHLSRIDHILEVALNGLGLLGIKLSANPGRMALMVELVRTMIMMRGKTEEYLSNLPQMTDEASKLKMELTYKAMVYAYDRSENLMAILGMRLLQTTLKKGNHIGSEAAYHVYAGILSIGFGQIEKAAMLNRVAVKSGHSTGNLAEMAMGHFGISMTTYTPLEISLQEVKTSFNLALQGGAHTEAAPSTMYIFFLNFLLGRRLSEVHQIVLDNYNFTNRIKTENFRLLLMAALQNVVELQEGEVETISLSRQTQLSVTELEDMISKTEHKSIRIYSRIFQLHNHILFEKWDKALQCEKEILEVPNVLLGTSLGPYFYFLRGLLHSQLLTVDSTTVQKSDSEKRLKHSFKKVHKFHTESTGNYEVWDLILNAELNRIQKDFSETQKLYDKAIATAATLNNLHDHALAIWFCAKFNKQIQNHRIADFYTNDAVLAFQTWGAESVVRYIHAHQSSPVIQAAAATSGPVNLDENSLMKLSRLISGEIDFEKLMRNLMKIFIENAGAELAVLILKDEDGNWNLEAAQFRENPVVMPDTNIRKEDQKPVSEAMLDTTTCHYVLRTGNTVVTDDAQTDDKISRSEYIRQKKVKSLICMPLKRKGDTTGLVYLENNMLTGAFQTDRIELLNYISTQIAVSVENSRLYTDMKSLKLAYERFVPKEFLQLLGKKRITEVHLGDQVQMDMTVLFADIRDFTGRSEKMTPSENFIFINEFLSRMEPIIRRFHGFVDKYIGDEIMALFPTNADDAVKCGIAMMHELRVYGDQLRARGQEPVEIGIGLNTGSLMLGTVGGEDRMNSTVISDTVNIASRVEKDTKQSGAAFIITRETYDCLKNPEQYGIRNIGKKTYRGKSIGTNAYEVFEGQSPTQFELKKKTRSAFEDAVNHFDNEEYEFAIEGFGNVLNQNPEDRTAHMFMKKLEWIKEQLEMMRKG
ncbi:MAG: AAA family ATPase [Bacteroidetes bacterium]|nr:AAA family ATPase [Bacteroidota bacterium]